MKKIILVLLTFVLCIAQIAIVASPVQAAASNDRAPTTIQISQVEGDWGDTFQIGQRIRLLAELRPLGSVSGIRWESSDSSVATVDENGWVLVLSTGTAQITATAYNGVESTFSIFVVDELPPLQYELHHQNLSLEPP